MFPCMFYVSLHPLCGLGWKIRPTAQNFGQQIFYGFLEVLLEDLYGFLLKLLISKDKACDYRVQRYCFAKSLT